MSFRHRGLARAGAGALGLFAAGAFAAPALAGTETDLELAVAGTKLAAGSEGKTGFAKITNNGPGTPRALTVTADLSNLDLDKIATVPFGDDCEFLDEPAYRIACAVPTDMIPGPGETLDYPVFVFRNPEVAEPYTGQVTFTISSPDDTMPDNNSKKVEVAISEQSGVDLGVWVPDVKDRFATPADGSATPLKPGDTTINFGAVFNWGDMTAQGVKVTVQLPEHVTFAETEADCEYSDGNRKAVCTYAGVVLNPTLENTRDDYVAEFYWPITVSADVAEGVTLRDGSWSVEALAQVPTEVAAKSIAPSTLPKNVKMASAQDLGVTEVDTSDNVDNFAVVLADGGNGGGGGGGSLPVTGAQAGLIGGIGLAVLAAGGATFMLARRRRVVLVTPVDEKPTE